MFHNRTKLNWDPYILSNIELTVKIRPPRLISSKPKTKVQLQTMVSVSNTTSIRIKKDMPSGDPAKTNSVKLVTVNKSSTFSRMNLIHRIYFIYKEGKQTGLTSTQRGIRHNDVRYNKAHL